MTELTTTDWPRVGRAEGQRTRNQVLSSILHLRSSDTLNLPATDHWFSQPSNTSLLGIMWRTWSVRLNLKTAAEAGLREEQIQNNIPEIVFFVQQTLESVGKL